MLDPAYRKQVIDFAAVLDRLDYFQILQVPHDVSDIALRRAYHSIASRAHPDRFYGIDDPPFQDGVRKIANRVSEAYVVLQDPERRRKYTADLAGPEREQKLRFSEQSEQEEKDSREEQTGKTPRVRTLWGQASYAASNGNYAQALKLLKMALLYEPGNELFQRKQREWSER
jgi:curved DNA-binding protein CbpA